MDRFIAKEFYSLIDKGGVLKSSMDRFIVIAMIIFIVCAFVFKIQYG